jgi:restriction endonuclease Mrr
MGTSEAILAHDSHSIEAVASLVAVVDSQKANRGLFVTTSRFFSSAQQFAEKHSRRLALATFKDVARWCDEVSRKTRS